MEENRVREDFNERLYELGEVQSILADPLFRVFHEDNSGALNFYEFMCIKNASIKTPEKKLSWIFTAFDQDGGGTIDVDEIRDTVVALFKMSRK